MNLFQNGHSFNLAIRCAPPGNHVVPFVRVQMAGASGLFMPVLGKVDTGAFRTMLNFDTACALGIDDPTSSPLAHRTAKTATGQTFPYYVHRVIVRIERDSNHQILFPLDVGFAERVARNLFGVDWLEHLCLAVDRRAVYFLRD
ncbi:MAG: hypothetical protein FJ279_15065 [Planctomycetes bacterium]|nr:hypothetical protein [Planctomycetota bacterium]